MDDEKILNLIFQREEAAIDAVSRKYGGYCGSIARRILPDPLDAEECVNDVWLRVWNAIPPARPASLTAYLGKITRNLSINRYQAKFAQKRAQNEFMLSLEELADCVPDPDTVDTALWSKALGQSINAFLESEKPDNRKLFVCRYFYCQSVAEIARNQGLSQAHVKSALYRSRERLRKHLEADGITI